MEAVTAAIFLVDENGILTKPTVIDEDTKSKLELYEELRSASSARSLCG